jgi:3-phenylpropionate/trans-cinnamate dioxygenase ferredoxin subunit
MPTDFVVVAQTSDLAPGQMKQVQVGDELILLVNLEGEFYAMDDICSHAYAPLTQGDLNGEEVECPLHGSAFNVKTGEVLSPPANQSIETFAVRVDGEDILVGPKG